MFVAEALALVIEQKWEKGIAGAPGDRLHLMQSGAREHDSPPSRSLVTRRIILGKSHFPAAEVIVQVDGDGKSSMRCGSWTIIAMGGEVAPSSAA